MISSVADLDAVICAEVKRTHSISINLQWQYVRGEVELIVGNCSEEQGEAVKQTIIDVVRREFPLTIKRMSTVPF